MARGTISGRTGGGESAYGVKPVAPPITSTAGKILPNAIKNQTLAYNQLPGYNASLGNIGANIESETSGVLPDDVKKQIAQAAAERAVATGTAGSENADAAYLRALGLTSLDLTGKGEAQFQSILPQLPGVGISQNPNFYVNPAQQYERDLQAEIFKAAPDPTAAAAAALGAVQSGYNAGRGSISSGGFPGLPSPGGNAAEGAAFMARPWEQPNPGAVGATNPYNPATSGYQPGTAGAFQNWNSWYNGSPMSAVDDIIGRYQGTVLGQDQGFESSEYGGGGGGYDPALDPFGGSYEGDPSSAAYPTYQE
jgi:hypothetical protein